MKITDVRLRKVNNQDTRMKALVSITFEGAFVIHDLRVIEGNNGLFVAMPSKRTPDGEFRDIAHPINSEMRQHVQEEVMRVYEETEDPEPVGEASDETPETIVDPSEQETIRRETDSDETGQDHIKEEE